MQTASEYFGAMAAGYDSLIRRAVPRYDEMLQRMIVYMPETATRVLELGCGTGNLSMSLAERYPRAELTLVDASPEMLALARSRIDPKHTVHTVETRFEELDFPASSFDLITSCISLHHLEAKAAFFQQLHELLQPGGTLIYCDQMLGSPARHHALNWDVLESFWHQPGNLTEDEVQELREHADVHDHYTPIAEQLHELEAAGFRELDVVWRDGMWGTISAAASQGSR